MAKPDSKPPIRIRIRKATDEDYARLERQGWLVTSFHRAPPWKKSPGQGTEQPPEKPASEKK